MSRTPDTPDTAEPAPADQPFAPSPVSRRRLIKQATTVGAVTVATGLLLTAQGDAAMASTGMSSAPGPDRIQPSEPLMVRVEARSGVLDFFQGHRHHKVHDAALVAALLRAAR